MQVLSFVESEKQFYETQDIPLIAGDDYSQYQLIRAINFARRSKYIDNNAYDDIIGDFPYDNISKYRIRLEARSTDFDFKHIENEPEDESDEARISSMVATKALHKKLRDIKFGKFLNKYADIRPEYGGFIAKKTKDGVHYVPWENVITDMSDILGGVIIERHYMRPAELKKTNWDNVDEAIMTAAEKSKKKDLKSSSDNQATTMARFIEVYEVHGELPKSYLLEAQGEEWEMEDENTYVLCSIIIAPFGIDSDDEDTQGVILKADEIDQKDYPYKYDVRHPVTGRGLGEGLPEELSEHQRWHNFYKTETARAIAIGGKVVFVTDDGEVVDSIYDEGIEHGTILKVGEGRMFQQANNLPNSIPSYQNEIAMWEDSANKNASSFDAVIGEEAKSGTPFRAQYMQNIAGTSQFEREREDMGFFIKEIVEDWILPEALEEAAKDDEIYESFTKEELRLIDKTIVEKNLTDEIVQATLERKVMSPEKVQQMREEMQMELTEKGTKRAIKNIKDFIKNAGKKVVVHTTDEQRNKAVLFESYSNALNLFEANDPARLALRSRILDQMGVTEQELALYAQEAAQMASQLPGGQQGGGTPNANLDVEQLAASEAENTNPAANIG